MASTTSTPPVGAAAYIFQDWAVIVLIAIALFAVVVIAGMIWGQKKARERHRAEDAAEERAEEAGAELPPASPPPPLDTAGGLPTDEPRPEPEPEPAPSPEPAAAPEPAPTPAPLAPAPIAARELAPEPIPEPAVEPEPEPEAAVTPQADPEPPAAEPATPEPAPEPVAEPEKVAPTEPVAEPEQVAPAEPGAPAVDPEIARALPLTTIKGLGPKVAAMLAERGFTRVDQLAALSAEDASTLDIQLGAFTGRITRDRWIEQAKLLAAGDTVAYEAVFGKLG